MPKNEQPGRRKNSEEIKRNPERRVESEPRRKTKQPDDKDLYKIPNSEIEEFIEKERRHDELDRINEVREQKRMWRNILLACLFMNLVFIGLAIIGANQ